jgi:hypothetical protein
MAMSSKLGMGAATNQGEENAGESISDHIGKGKVIK